MSRISKDLCFLGKRLPFFLNTIRCCISSLSVQEHALKSDVFDKSLSCFIQDQTLMEMRIRDLSILELACLSAMIRAVHKVQWCVNAAEAFEEYSVSKKRLFQSSVHNFSMLNFAFGFQSLLSKGLVSQYESVPFSIHSHFDFTASVESLTVAICACNSCPTWISSWLKLV